MCILRTDPSSAHGKAPAALLLGRPLVYPVELKGAVVDFTGTEFTREHVEALDNIHNDTFGAAGEKIVEYQEAYTTRLQRRKNPTGLQLEVGSKVQLLKKRKRSMELQWTPYNSYYLVESLDTKSMKAVLYCPKTKRTFKKRKPLLKLRKFRGNS